MIGAEILDSIGGDINKCYQNVSEPSFSLPNHDTYFIFGLEPHAQQEDWNALQFSCSVGDAEVTKTLISDGANPDCQVKVTVAIASLCWPIPILMFPFY